MFWFLHVFGVHRRIIEVKEFVAYCWTLPRSMHIHLSTWLRTQWAHVWQKEASTGTLKGQSHGGCNSLKKVSKTTLSNSVIDHDSEPSKEITFEYLAVAFNSRKIKKSQNLPTYSNKSQNKKHHIKPLDKNSH